MMLSVIPGETLSRFEDCKGSVQTERSFENDYSLDNRLRSGSFGVVYTTRHKKTDEEFAVKIIDRTKLKEKDDEATFREISVMKNLMDMENVVRLVDVYISPKSFHIVQIYAKGGDVFDRLAKRSSYSENDARVVSKTLIKTIREMHIRRLAHRDLKPENLLLKNRMDDSSILLADFGFTKFVPNEGLKTKCGTPAFVAPEILVGKHYDTQADMWSVGCMIYMLISGYPPFRDKTHRGLFRRIRASNFTFHDASWTNASLESKQLITSLLTVDPDYRPNADETLSMNWFRQSESSLSGRNLSSSLREMKKFNSRRSLRISLKLDRKESKLAEAFNVEKISDVMKETDTFVDSEEDLSAIYSNSGRSDHVGSQRLNLALKKKKKFSDLYTITDKIHRGSAGVVKKCYSEARNMEFAVKIIERNSQTDEQVLQEVSIMNYLDHENLVGVVDFFEEDDFYYIVMELMKGGDVFDRILSLRNYTENDARDLARMLLVAVDEMHKNGVAHRDIKPQNLFLECKDCNCNIKVGDFGFAKRVHTTKSLTVKLGTPSYVAPEVVKNQPYDQSCDMWSVGVVIYVMLCGYTPFREKTQDKVFERIKTGSYAFDPADWSMISEEAKALIRGLMCIDPDKRLTARQALDSHWIAGVSKQQLKRTSLESSKKRLRDRHSLLLKDIACAFKELKTKTRKQLRKEKNKFKTTIESSREVTEKILKSTSHLFNTSTSQLFNTSTSQLSVTPKNATQKLKMESTGLHEIPWENKGEK